MLFVRQTAAAAATESAPRTGGPPNTATSAAAELTIDVSELVPPEPMVRIIETLAGLPPGATLLVRHVRRPVHLYPRLEELGCRHETREVAPGRIEIVIRKPDA